MELDAILDNLSDEEQIELLELLEEEENYRNTHLLGEIELYDRDKQVAHWPLVTLESVGEGSMFSRLSDYFHHKA